jgi:3',5'-nucleoside bisphosphate phosphatase
MRSRSIFADLHTHSTASDGAITPSALVQRVFERGIKALALTDHDTVSGVEEARVAAEARGMAFLSGIEISATYIPTETSIEKTREIHILGYNLNIFNPALQAYTHECRSHRETRAKLIVARLQDLGIPLAMATVEAESGGDSGIVGRQHIATALLKAGFVSDTREAFDKFLADDGVAFVAKWTFPIADAIRLIHSAGGLAVLAHPANNTTEQEFTALVEAGLDGVEAHHPSHDRTVAELYGYLAARHGLFVSGGSDFHGGSKRDNGHLGRFGMLREDFEQLTKRIQRRPLASVAG